MRRDRSPASDHLLLPVQGRSGTSSDRIRPTSAPARPPVASRLRPRSGGEIRGAGQAGIATALGGAGGAPWWPGSHVGTPADRDNLSLRRWSADILPSGYHFAEPTACRPVASCE